MNEEIKEVLEEIQDCISELNNLCNYIEKNNKNGCFNCPYPCDVASLIADFEYLDFLSFHKIILDWYKIQVERMKKYKDSLDITISQLIDSLELNDEDDIEIITSLINDYDLPTIKGSVFAFSNSGLKVLNYRIKNYDGDKIGYHKLTVWTKE